MWEYLLNHYIKYLFSVCSLQFIRQSCRLDASGVYMRDKFVFTVGLCLGQSGCMVYWLHHTLAFTKLKLFIFREIKLFGRLNFTTALSIIEWYTSNINILEYVFNVNISSYVYFTLRLINFKFVFSLEKIILTYIFI